MGLPVRLWGLGADAGAGVLSCSTSSSDEMMMMTIKKDPPKHQRYHPLSQPFLATDQVVSVPLSIHVRDRVPCVQNKIYRELC